MKHRGIAGRFYRVHKDENIIVIGLLGNVSAYNLTEEEKRHILHFYNVKNFKNISIIKNFDCLNNNHFNNYLYIEL